MGNHCSIVQKEKAIKTKFDSNNSDYEISLVGNPNVGKSCLFNLITGLGVTVSNYPGTTVEVFKGNVKLEGKKVQIADLPGIYSLHGSTEEEKIAKDYAIKYKPDLIINIVDATKLERNLYLTTELLELDIPVVIALNFFEEAADKGIKIDNERLSEILGIPVILVDAQSGIGIDKLMKVCAIVINRRNLKNIKTHKEHKEKHSDKRAKHRYGSIDKIVEQVFSQKKEVKVPIKDRITRFLIEPKTGYIMLVMIMLAVFFILFNLGGLIEDLLLKAFNYFVANPLMPLINKIPNLYLRSFLDFGLIRGIEAGLAIAVPYISVFYLMMGILEDTGYLPIMAYLLDKAMHRFRLHGNAVIPLILGVGCNVPAILATRTLPSKSERFFTATLISCLIPCSALIAVIIGSVGRHLGAGWALLIFGINILLLLLIGKLLGKYMIKEKSGFIIELPPLRMPTFRNVMLKTWMRCKEFITMAFPYIIIGSGIVGVMLVGNVLHYVTDFFSPVIVGLLKLPEMAGITLIYGFLRKEMALEMLIALGGTNDLLSFMTPIQLFVFGVVTAFYIPCLATFVVLKSEFGLWKSIVIGVSSVLFAIILGTIFARLLPFLGILS